MYLLLVDFLKKICVIYWGNDYQGYTNKNVALHPLLIASEKKRTVK